MVAVSALVKRTKEGTVRAYSFAILFVFEKKWEVNDAAVMHGSKSVSYTHLTLPTIA